MSTRDPLAGWFTGSTPCPNWCEHSAAHEWEHDPHAEVGERWQRLHRGTLHRDPRWPMRLDVERLDTTADPDAPPTPGVRGYVLLFSREVELATAAELRALAHYLAVLAEDVEAHDLGERAR